MGKLIAINISEKRGTEKKEIQEAQLVADFGIAGDAHAGKWHRQDVYKRQALMELSIRTSIKVRK